jgi:hypothetical protein
MEMSLEEQDEIVKNRINTVLEHFTQQVEKINEMRKENSEYVISEFSLQIPEKGQNLTGQGLKEDLKRITALYLSLMAEYEKFKDWIAERVDK